MVRRQHQTFKAEELLTCSRSTSELARNLKQTNLAFDVCFSTNVEQGMHTLSDDIEKIAIAPENLEMFKFS